MALLQKSNIPDFPASVALMHRAAMSYRLLLLSLLLLAGPARAERASVLFIHPDGAGVAHWQAARFMFVGPDGELNWDRLPEIGVYRGHMKDSLTATSNGGATVHAYGVKVISDGFGADGGSRPPESASGKRQSILHEALDQGLRTALINSGSIIEPGTAAFVASVLSRKEDSDQVALQVIESGVDIILSGGEEWLLPEGIQGRHGVGLRKDGLNLIQKAKELGYTIVYTREELAAVPDDTERLLGVFARAHTFHDEPEDRLEASGRPLYEPSAPTLAEMVGKALAMTQGRQFFYVIEEEGTDNFGNNNNAVGTLEALKRTDEAFGVSLAYIGKHPNTLLITAADSEAGAMDVLGYPPGSKKEIMTLYGRDPNGAPYDVPQRGFPFVSAPDRTGRRLPFVITWGTIGDSSGGILVRAAGRHAEKVRGSMDNTAVYDVMYEALFGNAPGEPEGPATSAAPEASPPGTGG